MSTVCESPIFVGDIGTIFRVTITECIAGVDTPVDVSGASSLQFTFLKPDHTTALTKTAVNTTDGTDGKIQYTTISGDLDVAGIWQLQAKVVLGGSEFFSSIAPFEVKSRLA